MGVGNFGSPPHGRGKGNLPRGIRSVAGITPAWAGKSSCISLLGELLESPPQGGEKELDDRFKTAELGSPPRRRGKVHSQLLVVGIVRITPAWAGKSLFCFAAAVPIQDHPRVGGEKMEIMLDVWTYQGSPPHRRGKGNGIWVNGHRNGITPAWAGKSTWGAEERPHQRDHPRVGGEKPAGVQHLP